MIIIHDQKTLSLNFVITSVSWRHYVSAKIFVTEYLFLEYLFVSFDLFWQQKQPPEVFCKKDVLINFGNFTGKYLCSNLFVIDLLGHFEEHLWMPASVGNTIPRIL